MPLKQIEEIEESLIQNSDPEHIYTHIEDIQKALPAHEEHPFDVLFLTEYAKKLVYKLRGSVTKELSVPSITKDRISTLEELLMNTHWLNVPGHKEILKKVQTKKGKI